MTTFGLWRGSKWLKTWFVLHYVHVYFYFFVFGWSYIDNKWVESHDIFWLIWRMKKISKFVFLFLLFFRPPTFFLSHDRDHNYLLNKCLYNMAIVSLLLLIWQYLVVKLLHFLKTSSNISPWFKQKRDYYFRLINKTRTKIKYFVWRKNLQF